MITGNNLLRSSPVMYISNRSYYQSINNGVASIRFDATRFGVYCKPGTMPIMNCFYIQMKRENVHTLELFDEASGNAYSISYSFFLRNRQKVIFPSGKYYLLLLAVCSPIPWRDNDFGDNHHV